MKKKNSNLKIRNNLWDINYTQFIRCTLDAGWMFQF